VLRRFYLNGACWGLGNGIVSSSLIVYLAGAYGAKGFAISLILATPRLVGVLRLATPMLIASVGNRRLFCVRSFLASSGVLLLLPILSAPQTNISLAVSLAILVSMWTLYHLLEFLGIVALWSWIGEVVPRSLRGRFIGRRAGLLNGFQVLGMLLGAGGTWWWKARCKFLDQNEIMWLGYAVCAIVGAAIMGVAALQLAKAPNVEDQLRRGNETSQPTLKAAFAPYFDRKFRRFLVYGGWFSLANGITQTAAFFYQMRVLDISYAQRLTLDGTSQGIQSLVMPTAGRLTDQWGSVPVLVASQVLVAIGMLFFLIASPAERWWIAGAYLMWIAYAGINTAMPKLMLNLSSRSHYASYAAAWFAWIELVYALSTLAGGLLYDWGSKHFASKTWAGLHVDYFFAIFLLGFVLRLAAAAWAARIHESTENRELES